MTKRPQEAESQRRNGQPGGEDESPASETSEPFQRLEDLTRKLLQVPKKELDEKRKAKR